MQGLNVASTIPLTERSFASGEQLNCHGPILLWTHLALFVELQSKAFLKQRAQFPCFGQLQIIAAASWDGFQQEISARRQRTLKMWKQTYNKKVNVHDSSNTRPLKGPRVCN